MTANSGYKIMTKIPQVSPVGYRIFTNPRSREK